MPRYNEQHIVNAPEYAFCGTAQSPVAGFKSVSIGPGWTLLTVMPRPPTSLAKPCVNILTAPFVAALGTKPGILLRSPPLGPTTRLRPPSPPSFCAACRP